MNITKVCKIGLRKEMKTKLKLITNEEKMRQSKIVQQKLFSSDIYQKSQRISIFLSMDDEIDTEPILQHAMEVGKTCYIPRYHRKSTDMQMVRLSTWDQYLALPVTSWNIKQPPIEENCEEALSCGGLDLILVPGLAFTVSGHRLGRGRGYYDSYLSKCQKLQRNLPNSIALAFNEQILIEVPTEDTDVVIDLVLTAD